MTAYLIGYDLNVNSNEHRNVIKELEATFGADRFLELTTTWSIDCDLFSIKQIDQYLLAHLQESGSLFIIPFGVDSDQFDCCRFVENGKMLTVADIGLNIGFRRG